MLPLQERHSKRFHITLQIPDLNASIQEYCKILGETPCCVIPERLALWRTSELNFLLRAKPRQRTAVLQLGWEFDYLDHIQRLKDRNQLSWLFFATSTQDEAINRLNAEIEYNEDSDFLLELRNPNARWNLRTSLLLLAAMLAFTIFNNGWLAGFFRGPEPPQARQTQQHLYSANSQLQTMGKLLQQAGYKVDILNNYAVAQHPQQASITFQIINQQILFSTYWSLRRGQKNRMPQDIHYNINKINQEAIMCRYYQDEESDLVVEAWLYLPPLLLLGKEHLSSEPTEALAFGHKQAELQWQKTLHLWQQESLTWLQNSTLFGGELKPRQSFSKK